MLLPLIHLKSNPILEFLHRVPIGPVHLSSTYQKLLPVTTTYVSTGIVLYRIRIHIQECLKNYVDKVAVEIST